MKASALPGWLMLTALFTLPLATPANSANQAQVIPLWPGKAPGEKTKLPEEKNLTQPTDDHIAGRPLIRLGNVSEPTLTLYRPPAETANGTAVIVCPGGAYFILAIDLEGTEVCEWLNSLGITAGLLKYRVPRREGLEKHAAALQDAQRALGLLRHRAKDLALHPQRIGILGFSAGGHLAAAASTQHRERTYAAVDDADLTSCRPDFTVLIYPAYLTLEKQNHSIAPELPIAADTPPAFLSISQDDPVFAENAIFYALALKRAGVPAELHVYPTGGHGYGLRRTDNPVTFWPDRVTDWLRHRGWLNRPPPGS